MEIENRQIFFLLKIKKLLNKCNSKFSKRSNSIFYLSYYTQSFGFLIINNFLNKQKIFQKMNIVFNDLYSTITSQFSSISNVKNFKYKKIIISWAYEKDFKNNGSYFDRYLNINSRKERDTLWYLLYFDKIYPKKIDKNIHLFQVQNKGLNFFNLIKIFSCSIIFLFKDINYFYSSISTHNNFAINVKKDFKKFLNKDLEKILINYEAQPFQNELIRISKKFNKQIKIIGNIHAPLMSLPSHLVHKDFSPDKIIVNGTDIKKLFVNFLGWSKKKIFVKESLRILKIKKNMSNIVFLPYSISSPKFIIESFTELINENNYNLSKFTVQIHPTQLNSKIHLKTYLLLKTLFKNSKKNKKRAKSEKLAIFIGATGSVIEALERNHQVIHICEDVIFEHYSKIFYPNIISKKIQNNIFEYELKKKGRLMIFGQKQNNLKKYLF